MNRRRVLLVLARVAVGLLVPTAIYYLLRAFGMSVYAALVVSTLVSALPSLGALLRRQPVNALSLYFTVMLLGGLVVTAIPGGTRFLLAREAILTSVTGMWFVLTAGARRPLAYNFSRPLLEGRLHWPGQWDELWDRSPAFRRMWRISSVMWGVGLLVDAALRVLLAYTQPPDRVPALGIVLSVATVVVLNVLVHGYYVLCRVHDPRSPLRRAGLDPSTVPSGGRGRGRSAAAGAVPAAVLRPPERSPERSSEGPAGPLTLDERG